MNQYIKFIILLIIWIMFSKINKHESFDNVSIIKDIFVKLDNIFVKNNIKYWAIGGTLLGIIRHKDIVPWDDDGDIGISNLDEQKFLSLENQFAKYNLGITTFVGGYKIFDKNGKPVKVKNITQSWKYPFVDVFIYEKIDGIYKLNNEYSKKMWPNDYFPEEDLFPLRRSKFGHINILAPNNAYPYLNRMYGDTWPIIAYQGYDHEHEQGRNTKEFTIVDKIGIMPYLWIYWENLNGSATPGYIELCKKTIYKHCYDSFIIIELNNKNIEKFLPELKNINLDNLIIQQKVDYYRVLLLSRYGGMYMDSDIIVMKDPIDVINKLQTHDYVGFGCTGDKCTNGCSNGTPDACYMGNPSNWIMVSKPNGILINNIKKNMEEKLKNKNKFDYFDLGKYVVWEELKKLNNYQYYHYPNTIDGTRDVDGNWITTDYFFSNKKINYADPNNLMFIVLYNSGMDHLKKLSAKQLLDQDTNFSQFIKKSLIKITI